MGKKRRLLSCETCRRMKTRCDFDRSQGKCYRCAVLRLDCSLSEGAPAVSNLAENPTGNGVHLNATKDGHKTVNSVSGNDQLLQKISKQLDRLEARSTQISAGDAGVFSGSDDRDEYCKDAPLRVIRHLDHRLYHKNDRYDQMRECCDEIAEWARFRRDYCDRVCEKFLTKCGDYLVQGDKDIRTRAIEGLETFGSAGLSGGGLTDASGGPTSLLYAVLVLQGMRCDDQSTHEEIQPVLFKMIRRAISAALITSPLDPRDIEALLYMALYNPARQPNQPILDSWLATSHSITLLMGSVDVRHAIAIATGTKNEDSVMPMPKAMYIFRLFNELVLCHLQFSIALGNPIQIVRELLNLPALITSCNGYTIRDGIVAAEIKLLNTLSTNNANPVAFDAWKAENMHAFAHDRYNSLDTEYHYSYLLIYSRRVDVDEAAAKKAIEHSTAVVENFLRLSAAEIEALPNYPLCVLVFACLNLCKLVTSPVGDRHAQISMVTRIYWYLYHIGELPRDIVYTIANIIKNLVEGTGSSTEDASSLSAVGSKRTLEQQQEVLNPVELQDLPDIAQYATYDEFFDEIFSYMNVLEYTA